MTAFEEMAEEMEEEKSKSPLAPNDRKREGTSKGVAELTHDPTRPPLVQPAKDLHSVPTTLEGVLAVESEGKNANEVLGVLVAAHEKRAMSILQRTRLDKEDVVTVGKIFFLAKHGIGGRIPELNQPMPEVSEWALTILEALPSIDGGSRREFVEAWGKSQEERRAQAVLDEKRRQQYMGI